MSNSFNETVISSEGDYGFEDLLVVRREYGMLLLVEIKRIHPNPPVRYHNIDEENVLASCLNHEALNVAMRLLLSEDKLEAARRVNVYK